MQSTQNLLSVHPSVIERYPKLEKALFGVIFRNLSKEYTDVMNFDWTTWSIWLIGFIILVVWIIIPLKEFKRLLKERKKKPPE